MRSPIHGVIGRLGQGARSLLFDRGSTSEFAPNESIDELARSRIFDHEFYGAQIGEVFDSATTAAAHYVHNRAFRRWSPSPLISLNRVRREVRSEWERVGFAGTAAMLDYYRSPAALRTDWSPLFDPRELVAAAGADPARAVAAFLEGLTAGTPLPVARPLRQLGLTWGQVRERSITVAGQLQAQIEESRANPKPVTYESVEGLRRCDPADATLISIIMMTAGDDEEVLRRAIELLHRQTHAAWELIVLERSRSTVTLAVLRELAAADPRIRVVEMPGAGSGEAHQQGLDLAAGEYVALLDPHARWRNTYLSTMLAAFVDTGAEAVHATSRHYDQATRKSSFETGAVTPLQLQTSAHVDANALLVRTRTLRELGGFDTALRAWDEHDLVIRLAQAGLLTPLPYRGVARPTLLGPSGLRPEPDSPHWQWVVHAKRLLDWNRARSTLDERVRGRVSIVMPVYQEYAMTLRALAAVVASCADQDIEVLVIDNGSSRSTSHFLGVAAGFFPRTRVIRLRRNFNFAIGSDFGAIDATGEYVLFLNNDTVVRPGWLEPLLARLADPDVRGVQPLLVYPNETIQSAGIEFLAADCMPQTPLAGHPVEDGRAMRDVQFQAATAAALLMRAGEVVELSGFDPIFVNGSEDIDLCLRAVERFGGYFAVAPDSIVEHHESKTVGRSERIEENRRIFLRRWRGRLPEPTCVSYSALGLRVAHLGTDGGAFPAPRPIVVRPRQSTRSSAGATIPRLRWSIKNPAPGGLAGLRWGDTHFVEDLAHELEALGQEVVSYRRSAQTSPVTALDDVNLAIRGQFPVMPHAGKINLLWIISHPGQITADELAGYDLIYAASEKWAKSASERFSKEIRPLLQATDTGSFSPVRRPVFADARDAIVFVGQTRPNGARKVVLDALGTGVDLRVWGELWEKYIPHRHIVGEYFPNNELCALYQSARVVLADHHQDMARDGFVANRLFDAVCSGARVVSDPVDGIELLFGGAVQVYRNPAELKWLTSPEGVRASFPDDETMARIGRDLATRHSFAARASALLADALHLWATRRPDWLGIE